MKKTVLALLTGATPLTRATFTQALESAGFELVWAASSDEAAAASTRRPVDLLLLDMNRPLQRGWLPFERLTTLNPGVPVVLLTERKTPYEAGVVKPAGAVLQKPFSLSVLVHTMNGLLGQPLSGVTQSDGDKTESHSTYETQSAVGGR